MKILFLCTESQYLILLIIHRNPKCIALAMLPRISESLTTSQATPKLHSGPSVHVTEFACHFLWFLWENITCPDLLHLTAIDLTFWVVFLNVSLSKELALTYQVLETDALVEMLIACSISGILLDEYLKNEPMKKWVHRIESLEKYSCRILGSNRTRMMMETGRKSLSQYWMSLLYGFNHGR